MFNRILLITILVCSGIISYSQDVEGYASAVWMTSSNGTFNSKFYNVTSNDRGGWSAGDHAIDGTGGSWNNASNLFHNQNLGTHISQSGTINFKGGEVKTIHNSLTQNICAPHMLYRINNVTEGTTGGWNTVELPFKVNCSNPSQFGDWLGQCDSGRPQDDWQKWHKNDLNLDLSQQNEGDYQLEVHFRIRGDNSSTDPTSCSVIDYINDANEDGTSGDNYIATFKICPSASFGSSSNPTTCGGNGTITMNVVGVADGIYNNTNFYYGPVVDGTTFASVTVSSGVATITAPAGSYTDIRYNKTSGCSPTTGFDVTLSDPAPPAAPTGSAAQSFCSIDSPTVANLSATGNDIKWYDAATNGTQYATTDALVNGTSYFASQTDAVTGCESARLEVTVTIADPAAPTGDAAQSFCSIDNPTVANLTATGTSIQWYAAATGGSALAGGTALTTATTYYASQTVGGCESDTRFAVAVTIADPAAPTGDAAQSFCSIDNPTVANLVAMGTSIQWYAAATGGSALAGGTALTTATTYYASQTVGGCESDTRLAVSVTVADPAAPTGDAAQSFCSIDNPTVANLVATGTSIQWYAASTGGSALLTTTGLSNGTTYYATQTVGGCESDTRFAVTVTIADPAAPTGNAAQSFCSINNPTVANLAATGTNIQWYAAATGGSALAGATALTTATTYYATQTVGGCESDTRFAVTVTIADPAAPTGDAAQSFCSIDNPTVANLTATGTSIKWYNVATGGTVLATTDALTTGNYYATQTVAGCESDTRLTVAVTVADPAAPTGDAAQSFCSIDSPTVADLVVTGTAVQWYAAATGGSALATSASLTNGTTYYASQTIAGCESDTRLSVAVTVADPAAPTGDAAQSFCSIDSPTVADLAATGASVQWYAASTGGSALATTDALTDATTYYATQTVAGCESDTRFAVTVTLNDAAPTGDTTQDFCSITSPTIADLTATGTSIQWYAASTGGSALAGATALTTGTTYYASQTTGGCESLTRLAVLVTIVNPSTPTGDANQSFCTINNPTVADLEATGAGIQWYAADTGGSPLATTTALIDGNTYYASQTMGCESATRFAVTVSIADPAAPTGDAAQSFCSINNPTVADLVATGIAIKWYAAATGGTALATTTALTTATNYYASQTVAGCESDTRFAVAVTVADPAAPTGSAAQSFCSINNPTVADLAATGTSVQWYAAATGGSALVTTTALSNGVTYYATQTVGGCESDTRFAVTATIEDPAAPTGSAAQSFCSINNPTVADLTATGTTIQWYTAATGGTALATTTALTTATNYYASQTVAGCESDTRLVVAVTVADPSAPTGSATQSFCSIDNPTVADLTATGTTIQWYSVATGGTALATTTALTTATNYYASQTVAGCESDTRLVVAVTVADPSAPTGSAAQSFCSINNPTVADLAATGTSVKWYSAATGGSALATTAAITNGTTYYATQTVGGCESDTRFAVAVTVADPSAPTGSVAQSFL
ncbi:MAG: hypothetical protein H6584_04030 [Flavobacteriales bacterium]|nr:hypothetical protein [Flavobacteriales bacterium]